MISLILLFLTRNIIAHTRIYTVNGQTTGIQQVQNNSPLSTSDSNILCGIQTTSLAGYPGGVLETTAGSTLKIKYRHEISDDAKTSSTDMLDQSHSGPCIYYLAKSKSGKPIGKWSKISHDGFIGSDKMSSCINRAANQKDGIVEVQIPLVKDGEYLLRSELIALHEANQGKPQFYVTCINLKVSGGGSKEVGVGSSSVSIPGHVNAADKGLNWDIYNGGNEKYPIPGPLIDEELVGGGGKEEKMDDIEQKEDNKKETDQNDQDTTQNTQQHTDQNTQNTQDPNQGQNQNTSTQTPPSTQPKITRKRCRRVRK